MTFTYRTATDEEIAARHFDLMNGEVVLDSRAVAIMTGTSYEDVQRAATGAVLPKEAVVRGRARREIVEIKLGRDASMFDVLREYGDEEVSAG